jgi:glycosyltransferase involved in cell wall biosynthesis
LELPEYLQTGVKAKFFFSQAKHCRAVVVLSSHTAGRVETALGVPQEKIHLCPLPVGLQRARMDRDCECHVNELPAVYVSTVADVATFDPRKRLIWLFALAAALAKSRIGFVMAGTGTDRLDLPNVTGLGRLCDRHLSDVLRGSMCFAYTSAYEGQGLPPQEALALGVPVVALRNSSLPEMLGPGALWVEEPPSVSLDEAALRADRSRRVLAMVSEVLRLAGDSHLREATGSAGREFVATFSEERFKRTMEQVYQRAANA